MIKQSERVPWLRVGASQAEPLDRLAGDASDEVIVLVDVEDGQLCQFGRGKDEIRN